MSGFSRRAFLSDVGRGMLAAGVGVGLAAELQLCPAWAAEETKALNFGPLEGLAALIQETPPDKLLPIVAEKLSGGLELRSLVAATALANARTFGGQDYIGYHSFMALAPSWQMAQELPSQRAALPVLKVLYRNASRIQANGGRSREVMHELDGYDLPAGADLDMVVQEASRKGDIAAADKTFVSVAKGPPGEAFNHLQFAVQDEVDVHRVVLAWRSWASLDITGPEYATTLLRQSMRYCADVEQRMKSRGNKPSGIRELLPKLLDQHKLLAATPGARRADEAWLGKLSRLIATGSRDEAAGAVAAALAEGFSPEDVGFALALAANELVLRDPGRPKDWANAEKPAGSVHGDSVGVHASDAANAWRSIARVSNARNTFASLIVGAYHTAGQAGRLNGEFYPTAEQLEKVTTKEAPQLLAELDEAIRGKDQFRACAIVQRYGEQGHDAPPVFAKLLGFATSEDGALHAEKYYRTVVEEFASLPAAFRWREVVALARVTASEYGRPAPGYAQAKELLKV